MGREGHSNASKTNPEKDHRLEGRFVKLNRTRTVWRNRDICNKDICLGTQGKRKEPKEHSPHSENVKKKWTRMNGADNLFLVVFSRWKKKCFGLQSKFVNFKGDFSHYKRISPPNPVLLCDFGFCVCFHQRCPSCGQPTRSTTAQSSTTWPPPSDSHPLSLSLHGCVFHFKALHGRFGVFKVSSELSLSLYVKTTI